MFAWLVKFTPRHHKFALGRQGFFQQGLFKNIPMFSQVGVYDIKTPLNHYDVICVRIQVQAPIWVQYPVMQFSKHRLTLQKKP